MAYLNLPTVTMEKSNFLIIVIFSIVISFAFKEDGNSNGSMIYNSTLSANTITIKLNAGWNIFSSPVIPENKNLKDILQPLIDAGQLKKVMDESGNVIEDWGYFGGWQNNIGDMKNTEGYKINVTSTVTIEFSGIQTQLPFDIPLKAGWNIISYPCNTESDAQAIVQQLIDRGTLMKVMDENGAALEDWGYFGGWQNGIGNFKPGEGYKIKVKTDETLTIGNVSLPSITTNPVTDYTQTSATGGGYVTSDGGATVTARGVCWSTLQNPTITDSKTSDGTGIGSFTSNITGLTANTTYYVRAFATNSAGTNYGSQVVFTTITLPTVSTTSITNITQTTATSGGNITSDGGASITARGVCWSTSQNPTTASNKTTDGTGTGSFTSNLTGLTSNTKYYLRAYATNNAGTNYGGQVFFTTIAMPTISTTLITNITETTATGGGNVIADGGVSVTARGICWSISQNPTTANSNTTDGTGTGSFTSNLTGLTGNTKYYVRAYAINSEGTAYGNQASFTTTLVILPTVTTNSITNITQTTATSGGIVTNNGGGTITARGVCWNTSINPTTVNSKTVDGIGTGAFTSSMTGLVAGTNFYVRAYATNSAGTDYGEQKQFHAKNQTGLFKDSRDQTYYSWVKIGTQTWMSSNLCYLPSVSPSSEGSEITPFYYVYGYQGTDDLMARNFIDNKGVLYNWPAALSACPLGWHLPSDSEWTTLENYMIADGYNYSGTTTGNYIAKSLAATTSWVTSTNIGAVGNNLTANNSSGFSALPGGYRGVTGGPTGGVFGNVGYYGYWWTNTENNSTYAWFRYLHYNSSAGAVRDYYPKSYGFCVRCVKD